MSFPLFFHHLRKLSVFSGDISVIFPSVGNLAARAVLDPVFCIAEIPAAFLSQRVQRTVAEQAVEVLRIRALMTGKIFTFFMTEKRVLFTFPKRFLHNFPLSSGARLCSGGSDQITVPVCGGNGRPEQHRLPFNHSPKGFARPVADTGNGLYNSYEQANSIKNACFQKSRQHTGNTNSRIGCCTLHGSSTSPYKAGFLTSESMLSLPFSYIPDDSSLRRRFSSHLSYNGTSRDRSSVTVTGSFRTLT